MRQPHWFQRGIRSLSLAGVFAAAAISPTIYGATLIIKGRRHSYHLRSK